MALAFCATSFQATAQEGDEKTADEQKIVLTKELPNDAGTVEIVKVGQEPAVATIKLAGQDPVEFDAYESIEEAPEAARDVILDAWKSLGEIPKKKIEVEIDVTEAPDALEWAQRAKSRVEYWYPKVVEMLDGEEGLNKIPDDFKIRFVFKPFNGVAYAAGREITVSSTYIKRNPKDFGLVIHETTHIAQAYPRVREVWAMEGMTDYIRYFITEPRSKNHWGVDPERSKYTDSYGTTATFYDWIVRNKDPEFILKIHRVFRSRQSVEQFCRQEYDTTLEELWNEFISSLTQQTRQK